MKWLFGVNLVDQRTGRVIGRVVVVGWKGALRCIGFDGVAVRPHFLVQSRERYWAQDLGFSSHLPPDFPHVESCNRVDIASNAVGSGGDGGNVAGSKS
jgi:hypothetical protein